MITIALSSQGLKRYIGSFQASDVVVWLLLLCVACVFVIFGWAAYTYYYYQGDFLNESQTVEIRQHEFLTSDAKALEELLKSREARFREAGTILQFAPLFR